MLIRCWGSRGSIPVSGEAYLKYGGDTTCMEIRSGDHTIIIDAGTGIRRLGKELISEGRLRCDLIFTHAHWDHLMGFPFFKPLYRRDAEIRIHGYPLAVDFMREMFSKLMAQPNFPASYADIKADIRFIRNCPESFAIGDIAVTSVPISHPNQGNGYKFVEDGKTFVFLTDNELGYIHPGGLDFKDYLRFAEGSDLLIHDADFTEEELEECRQWGHSSHQSALDLAMQSGVKRLGLFHLNQERSDQDVDRIVSDCSRIIEEKKSNLKCFAVGCDMVIKL